MGTSYEGARPYSAHARQPLLESGVLRIADAGDAWSHADAAGSARRHDRSRGGVTMSQHAVAVPAAGSPLSDPPRPPSNQPVDEPISAVARAPLDRVLELIEQRQLPATELRLLLYLVDREASLTELADALGQQHACLLAPAHVKPRGQDLPFPAPQGGSKAVDRCRYTRCTIAPLPLATSVARRTAASGLGDPSVIAYPHVPSFSDRIGSGAKRDPINMHEVAESVLARAAGELAPQGIGVETHAQGGGSGQRDHRSRTGTTGPISSSLAPGDSPASSASCWEACPASSRTTHRAA
jgi:hypothetical protein